MNTHRHTRTHHRIRLIRKMALITGSLALLVGVTACSENSDDSDNSAQESTSLSERLDAEDLREGGADNRPSESSPTERAAPGDSAEPEADSAPPEEGGSTSSQEAESPRNERGRAAPGERSVIQKGNVSVASDDVGDARFDAKDVIDRHSGEIAEEETGTDEGEVTRVRMEIRVPQKSFDALMTDLSELGDLQSSTRSSEDVSTQVIDTRSRIETQERSIARIQSLLASAEDLEQIVAIESQLANRQADLESLKAQLTWLEDQSSLSTVTLSLAPTDEEVTEKEEQETGFVPGLKEGWSAFTSIVSGFATGLGAFLPFGIAVIVLLIPVWILIRRRPGRQRTPSAA